MRLNVGSRLLWNRGLMLPLWEELLWPFLDAWDSVRLRTASTQWNVPERYGPYGELFFFLLKKEPRVLSEKVKACALIGLHMMAEENAWRSDSGSSKSSHGSCEGNVGNDALHIIGLHGSSDTVSLFLQDCDVAKVALTCHTCCARKLMKSKGDVAGWDSERACEFLPSVLCCSSLTSFWNEQSVSNGFGSLQIVRRLEGGFSLLSEKLRGQLDLAPASPLIIQATDALTLV